MAQQITLFDLHADQTLAKKVDKFNCILNGEVPQKWVKLNEFAKNAKFLTIGQIEWLLTEIFQQWRIEVINYTPLFNAVSCHVRLHYYYPPTGEWMYQDGVGAWDVEVKKGSSAAEMQNINHKAIAKALPASKSVAIKDAAHHIGKLFGRDLNRQDNTAFAGSYDMPDLNELNILYEEKKMYLTSTEQKAAERILGITNGTEPEPNSFIRLKTMLNNKKNNQLESK